MRRNYKLERLQSGESFETSEKGNSMVPLIKSGQKHKLEPATWEEVRVGDIAYCKVKGNFYTHLVTAKNDKKGCQISNNQGYVNGWTKAVFGVVVEVIGGKHKRKKQKKMSKTFKEIEEQENQMTIDYGNYLKKNKSTYIEMGEKDENFHTMKFKTKLKEDESLSLDIIHNELLDLFISSGLSDREESKIIVSKLLLTPLIYDPTDPDLMNTPIRGVMVTMKYEFKNQ